MDFRVRWSLFWTGLGRNTMTRTLFDDHLQQSSASLCARTAKPRAASSLGRAPTTDRSSFGSQESPHGGRTLWPSSERFSTEEGEPTSVAPPNPWPKTRYDLDVTGSDVRVLREGEPISQVFSIADEDLPQAHEFLEDVGLSRVDAHMICAYIEQGSSIQGVFALR
jgi:hypothetical protein